MELSKQLSVMQGFTHLSNSDSNQISKHDGVNKGLKLLI